MRPSRSDYDAAVIGAGPVGSATALALARQGARVALLEANPRAAWRFAGEWLHPPGTDVLRELGLESVESAAAHPPARGFVVFPDDEGDPIRLPYPDGRMGLCCEHGALVEALRARAADTDPIDYLPGVRATDLEHPHIDCRPRDNGSPFRLRAERIVGADGRASIVRRKIGVEDHATQLSHMAGVELRDVDLPFEGYGHVLLGGPGPVLMYRFGEGRIRMCLDVPADRSRRDPRALWEAFAPTLPPTLRPAFRHALEERRVAWAANGFRPRVCYGKAGYALVGDAVGHLHPLTAAGMTLGMLDAECLARRPDLRGYQREREPKSHVPELLANALYQVFTREDATAVGIRNAVYRRWRADRRDRQRTMHILSGDSTSGLHFARAFVRMAFEAVRQTPSHPNLGTHDELPRELAAFAPWAQWPAASLMPRPLRARQRPRSTPTRAVAAFGPSRAEPKATTGQAASGSRTGTTAALRQASRHPPASAPPARATQAAPSVTEGGETASMWLAEAAHSLATAALASADGAAPPRSLLDWAELHAALRVAASHQGLECAEQARDVAQQALRAELSARVDQTPETQELAEGLASLARAGAAAAPAKLVREVADPLLARQAQGSWGDIRTTARACRALALARHAQPELRPHGVEDALERGRGWLRRRQSPDGAWRPPNGGELTATAEALDALHAAGVKKVDPAVRAGAQWLGTQQRHDGSWNGEVGTTGFALGSLLSVEMASFADEQAAVQWLVATPSHACTNRQSDVRAVGSLGLAARALTLHLMRERERPTPPTRKESAMNARSEEDWTFCRRSLVEVSRTFVRPIEMLPGELQVAVTCGYLLCRIVDTIEDHADLSTVQRDSLYQAYLDVLEARGSAETFAERYAEVEGAGPDHGLCRNLPRVMRVFRTLPQELQQRTLPWVAEMTRGMSLYSHRPAGQDGLVALHTMEDLQRYCYFVAGTVGHMLTEMFITYIDDLSDERALAMRQNAESFGLGLQLVNILKDVTDDRERSVSFIPRTLCEAQGISVADLLDPARREEAHAAVAPIFETARDMLDRALDYSLSIPTAQKDIRLFCLLPLWMAGRTLVVARGNDAMFTPGQPVKISRDEVEHLISECADNCQQDDKLRERYARLWTADRSTPVLTQTPQQLQ